MFGAGSGSVYTLSGQITLAATSDIGNSKNNGMLTLSGQITGPGGLMIEKTTPTLTDLAGSITIAGSTSNNYGGTTTINRGTVYLQKSGGALAIPGNVTIAAGGGAGPVWNTFLILKGSDQIASSAVMTFLAARSCNSYFELLGNNQTLAGISDAYGSGMIENAENESGINNTGTLTINNSDGLHLQRHDPQRRSGRQRRQHRPAGVGQERPGQADAQRLVWRRRTPAA